jgi:hypothetical protein
MLTVSQKVLKPEDFGTLKIWKIVLEGVYNVADG